MSAGQQRLAFSWHRRLVASLVRDAPRPLDSSALPLAGRLVLTTIPSAAPSRPQASEACPVVGPERSSVMRVRSIAKTFGRCRRVLLRSTRLLAPSFWSARKRTVSYLPEPLGTVLRTWPR